MKIGFADVGLLAPDRWHDEGASEWGLRISSWVISGASAQCVVAVPE